MSTMESAVTAKDVTAEDSAGTDLAGTAGPGVGTSTEPEQRSQAAANPVFAGPDALRRNRTVTTLQLSGGLAIVAVTLLAVLWYIPGIIRSDSHSFTGTVVSNGITNLNFASSGLVGRIQVHLGQAVKANQVLATETSSSATESLSADRASIAASQATLAALRAEPVTPTTSASIAAANAQLAKGQAQLSADKVTLSETQIAAPTGGTVIAINAQPGETVSSAGVRSYSALPQAANSQSPPFSLLPEGPTTTLKTGTTQTALPMIALRTSTSWEVTTLVPESHILSVRPGETATISVPAIGLRQIRATVRQVAPTPVSTSAGTAYQVTVGITRRQQTTPLNGMTADVQLGS
jgi:multidrug efflux pump subunit AcrA (membrane-fusion protein)